MDSVQLKETLTLMKADGVKVSNEDIVFEEGSEYEAFDSVIFDLVEKNPSRFLSFWTGIDVDFAKEAYSSVVTDILKLNSELDEAVDLKRESEDGCEKIVLTIDGKEYIWVGPTDDDYLDTSVISSIVKIINKHCQCKLFLYEELEGENAYILCLNKSLFTELNKVFDPKFELKVEGSDNQYTVVSTSFEDLNPKELDCFQTYQFYCQAKATSENPKGDGVNTIEDLRRNILKLEASGEEVLNVGRAVMGHFKKQELVQTAVNKVKDIPANLRGGDLNFVIGTINGNVEKLIHKVEKES